MTKSFPVFFLLCFVLSGYPAMGVTPDEAAIVEQLTGGEWLEALERFEYGDASIELLKLLEEKVTTVEDLETERRYRCVGRYLQLILYQRQHGVESLGARLSALGESLFFAQYWSEAQHFLDRAVEFGIEEAQRRYYSLCLSAQVDLIFERREVAMSKVERVLKECEDFRLAQSLRAQIDPKYHWFPGHQDLFINGSQLK